MEMEWKPIKCALMSRLLTCDHLRLNSFGNLWKMVFYV